MKNFKLPALALCAITIFNPTQSMAQAQLYTTIENNIFDNIGKITSSILIPIGVLVIIVNIILILWALIAGEKGNVGGRIGGIIAGSALVMIGISINLIKTTIFR